MKDQKYHIVRLLLIVYLFLSSVDETCASDYVYASSLFLTFAPDARSMGMGYTGVASGADAYAQYWNPVKLAFSKYRKGLGTSFTPWFTGFTNDIYLMSVHGYWNIDQRNVLGASLRYFNIGDLIATNDLHMTEGYFSPSEYALDFSYTRKITPSWGLGVTTRFLASDFRTSHAASPGSVQYGWLMDLSSYGEYFINGMKRGYTLAWGFMLVNIGSEVKNENSPGVLRMPAMMRLGASWKKELSMGHELRMNIDVDKLLVGSLSKDNLADGVFKSMFNSFSDSDAGVKGEIKECGWGLGAEYSYANSLFFRLGGFRDGQPRSGDGYGTMGIGVLYENLSFNIAYVTMLKGNAASNDVLSFSLSLHWK